MSKNASRSASADSPSVVAKPSNTWGVSAREFFTELKEQSIQVITLDGKAYNAILIGVDQYDLILRQTNGVIMLIPKHAIKMITPTGTLGK